MAWQNIDVSFRRRSFCAYNRLGDLLRRQTSSRQKNFSRSVTIREISTQKSRSGSPSAAFSRPTARSAKTNSFSSVYCAADSLVGTALSMFDQLLFTDEV